MPSETPGATSGPAVKALPRIDPAGVRRRGKTPPARKLDLARIFRAAFLNFSLTMLVRGLFCRTLRQRGMSKKLDDKIALRLPADLRGRIEHDAATEGRSIGNMTRRILERFYAEREQQPEVAA